MRLRDWLNKERYTVTEFAIRLDFSRTFMSCLLNGRVKCRPRVARQISRFTRGQVTVQEIMSEYKEPIKQKLIEYKGPIDQSLSEYKETTFG